MDGDLNGVLTGLITDRPMQRDKEVDVCPVSRLITFYWDLIFGGIGAGQRRAGFLRALEQGRLYPLEKFLWFHLFEMEFQICILGDDNIKRGC